MPLKEGASILFADERSRDRFLAYVRFLEADAERFAAEIETIRRLERSEIQYVVEVRKPFGRGVEGCLTTDGERVVVSISDARGVTGEVASLNSRFAHELEHARQFDAGEFALVRNAVSGEWMGDFYSYDIGDEVRAWAAQLRAATTRDFWYELHGTLTPTTLRHFADAADDAARARVLLERGYARVNPLFDREVRIDESLGFRVGDVVRPFGKGSYFGRVRAYVTSPS